MGKHSGALTGAGGGALSGAAAGSVFGPIGTGVGALIGGIGGGFMGSKADEDVPEYNNQAVNPLFDQIEKQAQEDRSAAMTVRATTDTASLLSRYGTRLALAGTGLPPMASMVK